LAKNQNYRLSSKLLHPYKCIAVHIKCHTQSNKLLLISNNQLFLFTISGFVLGRSSTSAQMTQVFCTLSHVFYEPVYLELLNSIMQWC